MNDDIEINIKVIPVGEDKSKEADEMLKNQILSALSKSFYRGYKREELENVTTLKQGDIEELPTIFKRFKETQNKYKHNRNRRRRKWKRGFWLYFYQ